MKEIFLLLGAVALPALAAAQTSVAGSAITVPSVSYRSVFADTPKGVETQSVDWKAANSEVGQFRNGHADILKWEAGQAGRMREAPMPAHVPVSGLAKP